MSAGLYQVLASFEASLREAPQDEEGLRMALRKILILRCSTTSSLEGRTKPIQP
jgi:hypothetical protein